MWHNFYLWFLFILRKSRRIVTFLSHVNHRDALIHFSWSERLLKIVCNNEQFARVYSIFKIIEAILFNKNSAQDYQYNTNINFNKISLYDILFFIFILRYYFNQLIKCVILIETRLSFSRNQCKVVSTNRKSWQLRAVVVFELTEAKLQWWMSG